MIKIKRSLAPRGASVDMTQGNIAKHLILFSLPLIAGNVFQQLYNMVDTWVVGNYVSNEAFSAVGSVGVIVNMLIGFFLGLSTGAGVVISQYYGARQYDKVHNTVHTAIVMTLILGVLFTLLGLFLIPFMLDLMNTPEAIIPESTTYLRIYFSGILGLMIYNIGAGILRAVGDSKRPFYFLVVSAIINTILDLVFVLGFEMGVEGVAYATVIAQGVSAILVLLSLHKSATCVVFRFRDLKLHVDVLAKILKVGLPAAVTTAITSFSNVFVQSYINYFDTDCMGGWTAYGKIDQILLLPMQSIAIASTTFAGQNFGIGQIDRAKKGANIALVLAMSSTAILMIPLIFFAPQLVAFFNAKPEVVEFGTLFVRTIFPFYLLCCFNQIYSGVLRGAGNSRAPMVIMLCAFVLFRQCYLFVMSNYIANEIVPIALGYPAGWIVCSLLTVLYYKRFDFSKVALIDQENS